MTPSTNPAELDDRSNNVIAAGGIFAVLAAAGLDPVIVVDGDNQATNELIVRFPFLLSGYQVRVTAERIPGEPTAAAEDGTAR